MQYRKSARLETVSLPFRYAVRAVSETISPKATLTTAAIPVALALADVAYSSASNSPEMVGSFASAFTISCFAPQLARSLAVGKMKDLSLTTIAVDIATTSMFTAYGFEIGSLPVIIGNGTVCAGSMILAGMKLRETLKKVKENIKALGSAATVMTAAVGAISYSYIADKPNLVGSLAAATLSTIYLPQAVHSWKTKSTDGLSLTTLGVEIGTSMQWLIYGIMMHALPIIGAETAFSAFTAFPLYLKTRNVIKEVFRG